MTAMESIRSLADHWQRCIAEVKTLTLNTIQTCKVCQQATNTNSLICQHCLAFLPRFDYRQLDGDLLNRPEFFRLFEKCHFDHLIATTPYQYPINRWLSQYKYHNRLEYHALFSELMISCLTHVQDVDIICPVPLNINKWQKRGYNQSLQMAKACARSLDKPLRTDIIHRVLDTKAQAELDGKERRRNLKQAFSVTRCSDLKSSHVLLIDDVITTGTTTSEISRQLKSKGVAKVTVLTLAISC